MTEYVYFVSYYYQRTTMSGMGNARVISDNLITTWDGILAMESAIRELFPEFDSVIVSNYQLLRESAA